MTNQERVQKALELRREGLGPYVKREMESLFGPSAEAEVARLLADDRHSSGRPISQLDVAALLKIMEGSWKKVFGRSLGGGGAVARGRATGVA